MGPVPNFNAPAPLALGDIPMIGPQEVDGPPIQGVLHVPGDIVIPDAQPVEPNVNDHNNVRARADGRADGRAPARARAPAREVAAGAGAGAGEGGRGGHGGRRPWRALAWAGTAGGDGGEPAMARSGGGRAGRKKEAAGDFMITLCTYRKLSWIDRFWMKAF
eukprot:XP_020393830.1 uncharacterized protein LOC109939865 [Zea mays]